MVKIMKDTKDKNESLKEQKNSAKDNNKNSNIIGLHEFINLALEDDKALDIVSIDLKDKSSIADFMFVATGTSSRHIASTADNLKEKIKTEFGIMSVIEGKDTGDWVIIDAGDIIVHLFRKEVREFYNLEKLWNSDFSAIDYTKYKNDLNS